MSKFLLRDGFQIAESSVDIFYDDEYKGWRLTIDELPNVFTDVEQNIYVVSETIGNPLPEETSEVTNGVQ